MPLKSLQVIDLILQSFTLGALMNRRTYSHVYMAVNDRLPRRGDSQRSVCFRSPVLVTMFVTKFFAVATCNRVNSRNGSAMMTAP